jgi:hypothetical protein
VRYTAKLTSWLAIATKLPRDRHKLRFSPLLCFTFLLCASLFLDLSESRVYLEVRMKTLADAQVVDVTCLANPRCNLFPLKSEAFLNLYFSRAISVVLHNSWSLTIFHNLQSLYLE